MKWAARAGRVLYIAVAASVLLAFASHGSHDRYIGWTAVPAHMAGAPFLGPPSRWDDEKWQARQWAGVRRYVTDGCEIPAWRQAHLGLCVSLTWPAGTP